jgi:hypothetical protein
VFWMVLIGLLVLGAFGSGAIVVLRKRARVAAPADTVTLPPGWED